jgi:dienelactone hydrolase
MMRNTCFREELCIDPMALIRTSNPTCDARRGIPKSLFYLFVGFAICSAGDVPKTVHFQSEDRKTNLVAYLFEPSNAGPHAAIVLLHGRLGAYSSAANGVYTGATLSKRHRQWGDFWAEHGYVAVMVDSFGPRGYPAGFGRGSYQDRPAAVSEQTVRPLDAYGALRYLRGRSDVMRDRIGVQGWSNGGMTVLVTMSDRTPGIDHPTPARGFRAGLAEYPGCGMEAIQGPYHAYAPLLLMIASGDEEVSPERCEEFAVRNRIEKIVYEGAEHNFDDPEKSKKENPANRRAASDAMRRAESFFEANLR